jgi:hypothetical protein
MASENGLVKLEYVKAVCPRSKRQLCNRSRPVYPLITGDSRWLRGEFASVIWYVTFAGILEPLVGWNSWARARLDTSRKTGNKSSRAIWKSFV